MSKTLIEMAREAGFDCAPDGHIYNSGTTDSTPLDDVIKRLVEIARADELEACERAVGIALLDAEIGLAKRVFRVIRARSRS